MTKSLNTKRYAIVALTVITALIHLGLGIGLSDPLFLLNGVGYLALIIALYFTRLLHLKN